MSIYVDRLLDLRRLSSKKSFFLFGPRQTGKSSLLKRLYPEAKYLNLLDHSQFMRLNQDPSLVRRELRDSDNLLIIDEIQKIPSLLDEIQLLIDENKIQCILTGSSARRLRRGGLNLLGGRARSFRLHPFCYAEIKDRFSLLPRLEFGSLPPILTSDSPKLDLTAYCGDYLQQEIMAEGLTRNLPAFSRFLEASALLNGQLIQYTKIHEQSGISKSTVIEYFKILKDTLIAFDVAAWTKSVKRRPILTSKYYFFDVGVLRTLQKRKRLRTSTVEFGEAFETFMAHELRAYIDYYFPTESLNYWRSASQYEVDFILMDRIGIEVKATTKVVGSDLKGLRALQDEGAMEAYVLVSLDPIPRKTEGILILPWSEFLERLWNHDPFKKL